MPSSSSSSSAAEASSSTVYTELDTFLASDEADLGMTTHARQLFSEILCNEDDPFKYFVNIILLSPPPSPSTTTSEEEESNDIDEQLIKQHAAISYRAMNMLKQDLSTTPTTAGGGGMMPGGMMIAAPPPPQQSSILIKNPSHAGLLAKDLLLGLSETTKNGNGGNDVSTSTSSNNNINNRYTTYHIRELLDSLLEVYPEKVMSAASAGGKQGIQDHLKPLMHSDQTLSILTHLVCYGCTGRKGIASAEKSAQHTAAYHPMMMSQQGGQGPKISIGQRKKFVKAIADFHLMDQLASELLVVSTSSNGAINNNNNNTTATEEICESILTILEVIGYPPEQPQSTTTTATSLSESSEINVGEDILLLPLTKPEWWKTLLLEGIGSASTNNSNNIERKESIARTCHQAFALSTGTSSRIVKSHAPATDATEQTVEKIVEEKEVSITNKLVEYGLTSKIHEALITQIPLLIQQLQLPQTNILNYQATTTTTTTSNDDDEKKSDNNHDDGDDDESLQVPTVVRHPGRYQTIPLGSWRLQLLSLLKDIVSYRGGSSSSSNENNDTEGGGGSNAALDEIMKLPIPPELEANKKQKKGKCSCCEEEEAKGKEEGKADQATKEEDDGPLVRPFNPWPALCSFLWAYPNNDFYHHIFFEMLQAVVLQHHEPTLRLILQKSKFLTKAVRSVQEVPGSPLRGTLLNCLNVLRLRSASLPPKAFLHQYLGSHDGWKDNVDRLIKLTLSQQTPIKNDNLDDVVNIDLGSTYASNLGLAGITEWDPEEAAAAAAEASATKSSQQDVVENSNDGDHQQGKKKKKKKKKKK